MEPIEVRSLLGRSHVDLAIKCLSSLVRTSVEPLAFALHNDGSLGPDEQQKLRDHLPISAIVPRKETEEHVLGLLKDYKYCHAYRIKEPIGGMKLFDIPLVSPGAIRYVDTDILFLAPHRGLFSRALEEADSVFARDFQTAFAVFPWQVWPLSPIRFFARVNSGIFCLRKTAYVLEHLDRYFAAFASSPTFNFRAFHAEQTGWSALAVHSKCLQYDPVQIAISYPGFPYDPNETLAIHFVSMFRHRLPEFDHGRQEKNPPRDVRFIPAEPLRPPGFLAEVAARVAKGRLLKLGVLR